MKSITTANANQMNNLKIDFIKRLDGDCLLAVMKTKEGRWFMMRMFDLCRVFQPTFTGDNVTFYNEGMRKVALEYLTAIKSSKEGIKLYHLAEQEYAENMEKYNKLIQELKGEDDE